MPKNKKEDYEQKPVEELTYAERLRREEDEGRYQSERRLQKEEKTGCLGMSASFLVGVFCLMFLIAGLGFVGYGISNIFEDAAKTKDIVIQIGIGSAVSVISVLVWIFFRKNLNNDK